MTGLLLRLAGPMQSWGEDRVFGRRNTLRHPTRSGLIGLFGAVRGVPRGGSFAEYDDITVTVRIDRDGLYMSDYQTAGGGLPANRTAPMAGGGYRDRSTATIQTWRPFLADAVFTVAVTGPESVIRPTAEALEAPFWQPYLGRRSYLPEQPMLLRSGVADPADALRTRLPLPPQRDRTTGVEFIHEHPLEDASRHHTRTSVKDVPLPDRIGDGVERSFATRDVVVTTEALPEELHHDEHEAYRKALRAFILEGR
ncbi:type I-E CRISPR-associated protein Cas5/CasD [Spiractinospora alimapuensis]|uniref:type I-E CRISPR-associated protein Cas5/CasD n=1 Tax=Spiractinospora alimapuensis TaxID=2820884 RepID=UPI001F3B3AA4|nr:type I-E CRISPR-associated protein Cas5/CasD [Spiractinospora alimapuensis]QVQ51555.1 type I-E CRISPR-associated protein Cas5/CasD [Spiractinospora alimapuensis]